MLIAVPKELHPGETRVPMIPETVGRLVQKGATIAVESGLGAPIHLSDEAYEKAGARIVSDREGLLGDADLVLRLRKPPTDEINLLKSGSIHVSFLDPFNERALVECLASRGVSAISMEMIPRSTRAQKMDALSSQANLAGYAAVIIASEKLDIALPMMMTPAGTLKPARVFIIGVGVAGLQAIATAKRLGARVDAFDTRPVVEEQVQSLGAKFVKIDLGETGQTKDGYAKELTPEQQQLQREGMAKVCSQSDIVITTAKLFGRKAPVIVTKEMVAAMRPGSIIVDLAAESGGNVDGVVVDQVVNVNGVSIVGTTNLEGHVPVHASQMYSANLGNLVDEFWNKESKQFDLKLDDEIIDGCLVTHAGAVRHPMIRKAYGLAESAAQA